MPRLIVKQENGKWGIWTTISDGWIMEDMTLEEAVEEHYNKKIREMEDNIYWAKFRRQEFLTKADTLKPMEIYYFDKIDKTTQPKETR